MADKQISFFFAYWKDHESPTDNYTVACAVVHDKNKYEIKSQVFPIDTPTYEACMKMLYSCIEEQVMWYIEFGRQAPTTFNIVTHGSLTKNEASSLRSMFGVYNRYRHVVLTPEVISDATQLVIKGKVRSDMTTLKQNLLTVLLKANAKYGLDFRLTILSKNTHSVDSQRFMTVFERARGTRLG